MAYKSPKVDLTNFVTGALPVANGGTGSTGITGFVAGSGSAYSGRTLTGSLTVGITNGAGGGDPVFEVDGGGVGWVNITGTSQTAFARRGFFANNAGLVTFTLNSSANLGNVIRIVGKGAGGWRIAQPNASSKIFFGNTSTTTGVGGSISSTNAGDCIELVAFDTNVWHVMSYIGTLTVV